MNTHTVNLTVLDVTLHRASMLLAKHKMSAKVNAVLLTEAQVTLDCVITTDCVTQWPPFCLSIRNCKAFHMSTEHFQNLGSLEFLPRLQDC
jgi:hypothetical protein